MSANAQEKPFTEEEAESDAERVGHDVTARSLQLALEALNQSDLEDEDVLDDDPEGGGLHADESSPASPSSPAKAVEQIDWSEFKTDTRRDLPTGGRRKSDAEKRRAKEKKAHQEALRLRNTTVTYQVADKSGGVERGGEAILSSLSPLQQKQAAPTGQKEVRDFEERETAQLVSLAEWTAESVPRLVDKYPFKRIPENERRATRRGKPLRNRLRVIADKLGDITRKGDDWACWSVFVKEVAELDLYLRNLQADFLEKTKNEEIQRGVQQRKAERAQRERRRELARRAREEGERERLMQQQQLQQGRAANVFSPSGEKVSQRMEAEEIDAGAEGGKRRGVQDNSFHEGAETSRPSDEERHLLVETEGEEEGGERMEEEGEGEVDRPPSPSLAVKEARVALLSPVPADLYVHLDRGPARESDLLFPLEDASEPSQPLHLAAAIPLLMARRGVPSAAAMQREFAESLGVYAGELWTLVHGEPEEHSDPSGAPFSSSFKFPRNEQAAAASAFAELQKSSVLVETAVNGLDLFTREMVRQLDALGLSNHAGALSELRTLYHEYTHAFGAVSRSAGQCFRGALAAHAQKIEELKEEKRKLTEQNGKLRSCLWDAEQNCRIMEVQSSMNRFDVEPVALENPPAVFKGESESEIDCAQVLINGTYLQTAISVNEAHLYRYNFPRGTESLIFALTSSYPLIMAAQIGTPPDLMTIDRNPFMAAIEIKDSSQGKRRQSGIPVSGHPKTHSTLLEIPVVLPPETSAAALCVFLIVSCPARKVSDDDDGDGEDDGGGLPEGIVPDLSDLDEQRYAVGVHHQLALQTPREQSLSSLSQMDDSLNTQTQRLRSALATRQTGSPDSVVPPGEQKPNESNTVKLPPIVTTDSVDEVEHSRRKESRANTIQEGSPMASPTNGQAPTSPRGAHKTNNSAFALPPLPPAGGPVPPLPIGASRTLPQRPSHLFNATAHGTMGQWGQRPDLPLPSPLRGSFILPNSQDEGGPRTAETGVQTVRTELYARKRRARRLNINPTTALAETLAEALTGTVAPPWAFEGEVEQVVSSSRSPTGQGDAGGDMEDKGREEAEEDRQIIGGARLSHLGMIVAARDMDLTFGDFAEFLDARGDAALGFRAWPRSLVFATIWVIFLQRIVSDRWESDLTRTSGTGAPQGGGEERENDKEAQGKSSPRFGNNARGRPGGARKDGASLRPSKANNSSPSPEREKPKENSKPTGKAPNQQATLADLHRKKESLAEFAYGFFVRKFGVFSLAHRALRSFLRSLQQLLSTSAVHVMTERNTALAVLFSRITGLCSNTSPAERQQLCTFVVGALDLLCSLAALGGPEGEIREGEVPGVMHAVQQLMSQLYPESARWGKKERGKSAKKPSGASSPSSPSRDTIWSAALTPDIITAATFRWEALLREDQADRARQDAVRGASALLAEPSPPPPKALPKASGSLTIPLDRVVAAVEILLGGHAARRPYYEGVMALLADFLARSVSPMEKELELKRLQQRERERAQRERTRAKERKKGASTKKKLEKDSSPAADINSSGPDTFRERAHYLEPKDSSDPQADLCSSEAAEAICSILSDCRIQIPVEVALQYLVLEWERHQRHLREAISTLFLRRMANPGPLLSTGDFARLIGQLQPNLSSRQLVLLIREALDLSGSDVEVSVDALVTLNQKYCLSGPPINRSGSEEERNLENARNKLRGSVIEQSPKEGTAGGVQTDFGLGGTGTEGEGDGLVGTVGGFFAEPNLPSDLDFEAQLLTHTIKGLTGWSYSSLTTREEDFRALSQSPDRKRAAQKSGRNARKSILSATLKSTGPGQRGSVVSSSEGTYEGSSLGAFVAGAGSSNSLPPTAAEVLLNPARKRLEVGGRRVTNQAVDEGWRAVRNAAKALVSNERTSCGSKAAEGKVSMVEAASRLDDLVMGFEDRITSVLVDTLGAEEVSSWTSSPSRTLLNEVHRQVAALKEQVVGALVLADSWRDSVPNQRLPQTADAALAVVQPESALHQAEPDLLL